MAAPFLLVDPQWARELHSDLQTARQATFSRARANEPPHDPRGHAAPATVEHTDMWSSAHERLTWEVGTFDLRPSQKRTSSLSKLSQVKLVESKSARCAGGAMGSAQYFKDSEVPRQEMGALDGPPRQLDQRAPVPPRAARLPPLSTGPRSPRLAARSRGRRPSRRAGSGRGAK